MSLAQLEQRPDLRLGNFHLFHGELPPPPVEIFLAETHMHVRHSDDDGSMRIPDVVESALEKGLDLVALTGHNSTAPSLEARAYVRDHGLEGQIRFPVAEEVDSQLGHLGLIGISEEGVSQGMSVVRTIAEGQEQGGIVIGEHFGLRWVNSMPLWAAQRLQGSDSPVRLDGGEFLNGGTALAHRDWIGRLVYGRDRDRLARRFFDDKAVNITPIGGTDGHASSVGLVATAFWGCSREEAIMGTGFEDAVRASRTAVVFNPMIDQPGRARQENIDSLMAWPMYLAGKYLAPSRRKVTAKVV